MTALMVASSTGNGIEFGFDTTSSGSSDHDCNPNSGLFISDLIRQGAAVGCATERYGETSLHLAARNARADAAKRLLEAGQWYLLLSHHLTFISTSVNVNIVVDRGRK